MNLVPGANPDQEGMSEHHERDVPQPPEEAADFVVVQPQIFRVFQILVG